MFRKKTPEEAPSLWIASSDLPTLPAHGFYQNVQELMGHKSASTTQRYAMVAAKKVVAAARPLQEAWHPVGSTVGR